MSIDPTMFLHHHAKAHPSQASVLTTHDFVAWWDEHYPGCHLSYQEANLILNNLTTTQEALTLASEFDATQDLCWSYTMK
ncbi:hypothetical protein TW78_22210 [Vibrio coralliilyticus]|jgi:hypothetical protein|uniref:Uncharacterized protein n=1 Tax=Vibrio coralliilyticus TaxID=190893 RepID=A0A1V0IFE5_9VIBR|nr:MULTISPECIES: hypothetical protein [Vibrio]ARC94945.1 hypothetical protein B6A42_26180 [Vibrio coralliilyticus]ERB63367.1 hypothetical protein N779_21200 [Vibrio coralliilyticus OCN008]KJY67753.1 hypothetical protein TW78_22210 [Vibrio coralliilyticus]NOI77467.1 hypothetical protein [Vibrio coralliilyticus]NOJ24235.1 hypothetical protein [Vibrio coralliilyticus]